MVEKTDEDLDLELDNECEIDPFEGEPEFDAPQTADNGSQDGED